MRPSSKSVLKYILCLMAILLVLIFRMSFKADALAATMGTWGTITWHLDFTTGELIVGGEGETPRIPPNDPRRYEYVPWFEYRESIKSIVIEDGVTDINDDIFFDCVNLTNVKIGKNLSYIPIYVFGGHPIVEKYEVHPENEHFVSVDGILFSKDMSILLRYPTAKKGAYVIPESVVTIGNMAFEQCAGLTEITITPNVTAIGSNAFFLCTGLTELYIPDTVTTVQAGAFHGCRNVGELYISKSLTFIEPSAFDGLEKVKHIDIPKNVKKIGSKGFANCTSLESVVMHKTITNVHLPFDGCENLEHIYYIGSEADTYRLNIRPEHFFISYTLHYGTSGTLPGGIEWELESDRGTMRLTGNGELTGNESIWAEYGEVIYGVYVSEGITGIQNCLDSAYKSCGTETKNGNKYNIYGRPCTITFKGNVENSTITKQFGEDLVIPYDIPYMEHYDFDGWSMSPNGYEPDYMWGDIFKNNVDTTLHPIWGIQSISGIKMVELPEKTVYKKGEKLDMNGAVLQVKYKSGRVCSVTEDFSVSGYDPSKVGKQKITVQHGEHKTSFYVTVESEKATPIKIQPIVTKTEYMVGEKLDLSTISLKLTFSDGSTKIVKSDFSVSGFSSDSAGTVTVTVSYQELNSRFEVIISEPTPPPTADESQDDISITESEDETDTSSSESQDESTESNDETDTSSCESQDESTESNDEADTSSSESQDESTESNDETNTSLDEPQDESPEPPSVSKEESSDGAPAILRGEMQMWVILLVFGLVVLCVIVLIVKRRSQKNKE